MARLRSSVRELEVALMKFCFNKLGAIWRALLQRPEYALLDGLDSCRPVE